MYAISVDPGLNGAAVFWRTEKPDKPATMEKYERLPTHKRRGRLIFDVGGFNEMVNGFNVTSAYVERPLVVFSRSRISISTIWCIYGEIIGVLTAKCGDKNVLAIDPREWQEKLYAGCPRKLKSKERSFWAVKKILKYNLKPRSGNILNDGIADAMLIGAYGLTEDGWEVNIK